MRVIELPASFGWHDHGKQFHAEIGAYAKTRGIGHLFAFGNMARSAADAYGKTARHFTEMDAMNHALKEILVPDMTVLVKGSRFMKMERVADALAAAPEEKH